MSYRSRLARPPLDLDREIISDAYRKVFGTAEGNIVLDHIMQTVCGVDLRTIKTQGDALLYQGARRDVGLEIWGLATGQGFGKPEVKTHE